MSLPRAESLRPESFPPPLPQARGVVSTTRLRGRWLVVARLAWVVAIVSAIGLQVLALPTRFEELRTVCTASNCGDRLTPAWLLQLHGLGLSAATYAAFHLAVDVALVLTFLTVATLIVVLRSDDWLAVLGSLTLVAFGASTFSPIAPSLVAHSPAWWLPVAAVSFLGSVAIVTFFYLFPDGRFVPGWIRWLAGAWVALEAPRYFWPNGALDYTTWWSPAAALIFLTAPAGIILAQVYRYRRVSSPVQRQQTKWVVFGLALAVGGFEGLTVLGQVTPWFAENVLLASAVGAAAQGIMLFLPLSIGLSILRYRLWDVDLIIRRTLVYGALTGCLAVAYYSSVVALQGFVRALTGQSADVAVVGSTLAVAALVGPLRRRIQVLIDRNFYRRRYDARQVLAAFGATMRDEVELATLTARLVEIVEDTMQPAHLSLWLREPEGPMPVREA
jgi:hypothetical protein